MNKQAPNNLRENVRRSQVERSDEARKAAIEAAVQLLVSGGFSAATTTSVALKAGMSRGRLTHQFPTKDTFLIAICEHLVALFIDSFSVTLRGASVAERVSAAVRRAAGVYLSDDYVALLHIMFGAAGEPELKREITAVTQRIHYALPATFRASFGDFDRPKERIDLAFRLIVDVLRGMAISRFLGRSTVSADVELEELIRIATETIGPGAQERTSHD